MAEKAKGGAASQERGPRVYFTADFELQGSQPAAPESEKVRPRAAHLVVAAW